jgi:hypothetical protein
MLKFHIRSLYLQPRFHSLYIASYLQSLKTALRSFKYPDRILIGISNQFPMDDV